MTVRFVPVDSVAAEARAIVRALTATLEGILPADASILHVGATALLDGITKGDVDVAVRTSAESFAAARAALDERFVPNAGSPRTESFASYEVPGFALPAGIQLVVRDSELDIFHRIHARLASDAQTRARYTELKSAWEGRDADAYREAKSAFFDDLLASIAT